MSSCGCESTVLRIREVAFVPPAVLTPPRPHEVGDPACVRRPHRLTSRHPRGQSGIELGRNTYSPILLVVSDLQRSFDQLVVPRSMPVEALGIPL